MTQQLEIYPACAVVFREPVGRRLSQSEMAAARREFNYRALETDNLYARFARRNNTAVCRFLAESKKLLKLEEKLFFSAQDALHTLQALKVAA